MVDFDENRRDFAPYGFTCVRWRPTIMNRPDRHNEIELNLLETGSLTYLLGGQKITIPARRLAVFWAGMPHQIIQFRNAADYSVVTIPLVWFLQWRLPQTFVHFVLHGQVALEPDRPQFDADRLRFKAWTADLAAAGEERRRICLLEIEARLRRLALSIPSAANQPVQNRRPAGLGEGGLNRAEQMARFIAQHYTEPLTIERISRAVALHPNYAMQVFQQLFGATLLEYVSRHRLAHAQRLLVTTQDLIVNIAHDSGFGSLSRFNEAFRRAFGCTPRQYRDRHRR